MKSGKREIVWEDFVKDPHDHFFFMNEGAIAEDYQTQDNPKHDPCSDDHWDYYESNLEYYEEIMHDIFQEFISQNRK